MYIASLRFLFMISFLLVIVAVPPAGRDEKHWPTWFLWSLVGFGIMHAPECIMPNTRRLG